MSGREPQWHPQVVLINLSNLFFVVRIFQNIDNFFTLNLKHNQFVIMIRLKHFKLRVVGSYFGHSFNLSLSRRATLLPLLMPIAHF